MSEIALRDVQLTLDDLATEANREHELCRQAYGAAVLHALNAGQSLIEAKAQLAHGAWLPWLAEKFEGSEDTAERYMTVASNSARVRNMDMAGLSLRAVLKRLERINRENKPPPTVADEYVFGDIRIRHGDFRDSLGDVFFQADAIVTDPPYAQEFLGEWDELSRVAASLLTPAGTLVAMAGQTWLPEYMGSLGRHLKYRWCGSYLTDGPATRVHGRKVGTKWKPILIFDRGEERRKFLTQDIYSSNSDDKAHHHWGQSESGIGELVERFTEPGQLVVDPFLGGGTTAIVCRDLGRRFVGCDIDAAAVDTTRKRLA